MQIKTLKGVDNSTILKAFNTSFSDYFIQFELSYEQLKSKLIADKVNLNLSVGTFENNELIGFILHGIDRIEGEKVIYNGGTGVVPDKRGQGLTHQMYQFIVPILKENAVNKLVLEVISNNIQAIKSYKKSGYAVKRNVLCYKGEISIKDVNEKIKFKHLEHYEWPILESFWDGTPTWQNSSQLLNELTDFTDSIGAYLEGQLVGYLIVDPQRKRIQQLAVKKDFRRSKIAASLLSTVISRYGNKLSIINVDKRITTLHQFLAQAGFEQNLEQLEMILQLT